MSYPVDDFPYNLFGDDAAQFIRHLYDLDAALWVAGPGWDKKNEVRRPDEWQKITCTGNRERLETYDEQDRPIVCVNTGFPFAVFDSDTKNGGDPEKVRALLIEKRERIYAEIDSPSGGKHFYIAGHRDLPTVHSRADNPKLPDFPGLDIQSHWANVFTPGTLRPKYRGHGYDVVFDELDQIVDAEPVYDDDGNESRPILDWVAEQLARSVKTKARKTSGGAKEWEWDPCEPWDGTPPDVRQSAYLHAAVTDEAAKVAAAKSHRNDTLFEAALKLGSYVSGAGLDEPVVIAALQQAAETVGLIEWTGERQINATIRSGLRDGKRNPRAVPPPKTDSDGKTSGKKPTGTITVTSVLASQVKSGVPEWTWRSHGKGRVMRSTLVLFGGRPSAGKSTAARWLASGYSNGTIPGCFEEEPQNVAYIVGEESLKYVVKPSLLAHGADMSRIHFPKVEIDGEEVRLQSVRDELALTQFLLDNNITVIFVDPIMSTIGAGVDIHRSNQTRAHVDPWVRVAEKTNGVVHGIVHLRKELGTDILAAVNGSSAFGEVARSVIAFAREETTGDRVLSQVKNSAGDIDLSLSYTIGPVMVTTDEGRAEVGQFVLGDVSERRVGDLLRADSARERLGPRSWQLLEAVRVAGAPVGIDSVHAVMDGMERDDVGKYLRRLVKEGLLVKAGRGLYDWPGRLAERLAGRVD